MRLAPLAAMLLLVAVALSGCAGGGDAGPGRVIVRLDGQATRGILHIEVDIRHGDEVLWHDAREIPGNTNATLFDRVVAGGEISVQYKITYAHASETSTGQTTVESTDEGKAHGDVGLCATAWEFVFLVTDEGASTQAGCIDGCIPICDFDMPSARP